MDKSQAMVEIMIILNKNGRLNSGNKAFEIVRGYISFKIDRLGPEKALQDVRDTSDHLVAQIERMTA